MTTRAPIFAAMLLSLAACSSPGGEESAVRRGDTHFAQGDYEEALAEYRLALRQGSDDASTVARVAQTYAMLGRVDDAGTFYREAAELDGSLADQAVAELMRLAREARRSGDRFAMATAAETALGIRPGIGVGDMSLDLARHYFRSGQYGRALPFFQKALTEATDSAPEVVFEVGQAYEEIGDCERALAFFERFRSMVPAWERGEVDWYIGTCAFRRARDLRASASAEAEPPDTAGGAPGGVRGEALRLVERTIAVGEPRNLLAEAWFEKGQILSELGRCEEAMEAFAQVRYADAPRTLVERAQDRFDEIRFGRGLEELRGGRCG